MRKITQINVKDSKRLLMQKLVDKLGNDGIWLPEYDQIADWLSDNKQKGLLLRGYQGVGKTLICKEILPEIFNSIGYGYDIQTPFTIGKNIREITGCDSGVPNYCPTLLDDVGIETPYTEFGNTVDPFVQLTYYAEQNGQLLILTTNFTEEWFAERYGPRVIDRLNYLVRTIEFKSRSLRK